MKTILTPVDFSNITPAVLDEASALARAMNGRVVLLAVVQPPVVVTEYAVAMDNIAEITAASEKNAAQQLARLEEKLRGDSVSVDCVQVIGAPVANILDQAEKHDADYIVMGSHGHTAFYELLVGSTTHGVLKRAKCPVVIVPSAQGKALETNQSERRTAVS